MQNVLQLSNEQYLSYKRFFLRKKNSLTLTDILVLAGILDRKKYEKYLNRSFSDIKSLDEATASDISFFINKRYKDSLKRTKAGVCILSKEYNDVVPDETIGIYVENPHYIYTVLMNEMFAVPQFIIQPNISLKANINSTAQIGSNVEIQDGVFIGKNVIIGNNCKICANAVISDNCIIGDNSFIGSLACVSYAEIGEYCVIQNGATIGQCGFGFAYEKGFNYKIPQLGIVKIGNFVEIGANSCIDRGAITDTVIGDCTKIDNIVHLAHGVFVGKGCFFAAGTVVAGSVKFGNFVQVGGHSAIGGHIKIGDGAQIAGHSGVAKDVPPMGKVGGYPAVDLNIWKKIQIKLIRFLTKNTIS